MAADPTKSHLTNMNNQNPKKPGRPTIRTPEIENILIEAAETGAPIKACCATARISYEPSAPG
jgi:hypothetical protein